ncbi:MAG: TIM-barrel domain-containing protein [Clostridium sp.]
MRGYLVNENIIRYEFGNPIETNAVVDKGDKLVEEKLSYFDLKIGDEIDLIYDLDKSDKVYGLGENIRGINKRGWIYESFCSDDPNHAPDKRSLYGAHNFFVVYGKERFGVFIDFPSRVIFDVGYENKDKLQVKICGNSADIYFIKGESFKDIVRNFLRLIGKGYVPPKWAFGYIQSRWSYPNESEVRKIGESFNKKGIPCDGICLDIDYMEDFKDFTLNKESFKNFKVLVSDLKAMGIKIIPIIDAGVKIEKGYFVYEEGVKNNYFVLDEKGKPYVGAVWPGKVHFPDFLNDEARKWFGLKYKELTDMGVIGFWNDMNEPAIFYSEKGISEAYEKIDKLRKKELNIYTFFELKDTLNKISNSMEDYKGFYHRINNRVMNHYDVHNLYGYNMTKSADEGLREIDDNKRFLLFSRASYIGAHRHGGVWTGDNSSYWEHLIMNIKMMPSLNMCGFLYSGADTCGFNSSADSELAVRWNQFSIFTPLFRNHSSSGTRKQEPFSFDSETEHILKETIKFRYSMIPYLYSEFMKSINSCDMFIKPLVFDYEDDFSSQVEDELLIGESLMIAPVYEQNKRGRYVYLPEEMLLWKVSSEGNLDLDLINQGHSYIDVDINEFCLFIRKNKIFVYGESAQSVEKINNSTLNIIAFVLDKAEYNLYDDDGISKNFEKGSFSNIKIIITLNGEAHNIHIEKNGVTKVKTINFKIVTAEGKIIKDKINI